MRQASYSGNHGRMLYALHHRSRCKIQQNTSSCEEDSHASTAPMHMKYDSKYIHIEPCISHLTGFISYSINSQFYKKHSLNSLDLDDFLLKTGMYW